MDEGSGGRVKLGKEEAVVWPWEGIGSQVGKEAVLWIEKENAVLYMEVRKDLNGGDNRCCVCVCLRENLCVARKEGNYMADKKNMA